MWITRHDTLKWYEVMQVGVSDAQHLHMVQSYASGGFGCTTPRNGTSYARVVFYSTSQKNGTNSSMWGLEVRNSHKWHKVTNIFDFGAQHTKVAQGCAHVCLKRTFN